MMLHCFSCCFVCAAVDGFLAQQANLFQKLTKLVASDVGSAMVCQMLSASYIHAGD